MADINFDRAAGCGACGHSGARHIWGPERASMAGDGCDGWTATAPAVAGREQAVALWERMGRTHDNRS